MTNTQYALPSRLKTKADRDRLERALDDRNKNNSNYKPTIAFWEEMDRQYAEGKYRPQICNID